MKFLSFVSSAFLSVALASAQEITVGQPRIWRYERVYSLVDGLLRDVEAVQLNNMTKLDPNAINSTSIDMLQTMLRAGVSYDQALGLTNSISRQNFTGATQNAALYDAQYTSLMKQQTALTDKLTTAQIARAKAQQDLNAATAANTGVDAAKQAYTDADTAVSDLKLQIADSKTSVAALGNRPDVAVNGKSNQLAAGDASTLLDSSKVGSNGQLSSMWNTMPKEMKDLVTKQMGNTPNLPATKQFDNYITLLYERMARELAALNDDTARAMHVFLLGFDVGLYPGKHQKNQVARVAYSLGQAGKCSGARAYQLYPGVSAYNLAEYSAQTHANLFSGALRLLNGIGANADYQRLKEEMHSSATQSVYISGFGAGLGTFGWYLGAAPFEATVSPGIRTMYAFVLLPDGCEELTPTLSFASDWQPRTNAGPVSQTFNRLPITWPVKESSFKVERLAYDPFLAIGDTKPRTVTMQVELSQDVDPNLIVTVGSTLLHRVRDWRGRATTPQAGEYVYLAPGGAITTSANGNTTGQSVALGRGLLEADQLDPDTWIATNSNTILLNISTPAANTPFPSVRLQAGGYGIDLLDTLATAKQVRMGDLFLFPEKKNEQGDIPREALMSFFLDAPKYPNARLQAHVSHKDAEGSVSEIHLSATDGTVADSPLGLTREAVVLLSDLNRRGKGAYTWPLRCEAAADELNCRVENALLKSGCKEACPHPASYHVQLIQAGLLRAATDFDPKEEPKIAFARLTSKETWSSADGKFTGWQILVSAINVPDHVAQLDFSMPSDDPSRPNRDINSHITEDGHTFRFEVDKGSFSSFRDEAYLYGWTDIYDVNTPSCKNVDSKGNPYCKLGNITGLRSLLLPVVSAYDEATGRIDGKNFGPITGILLDSDPNRSLEAHIGEDTIIVTQAHDAKTGTGLLYFQFAGVPVPVMYNGRQIVWSVKANDTGTTPKLPKANDQPAAANSHPPSTAPATLGKVPSGVAEQKKLNMTPY